MTDFDVIAKAVGSRRYARDLIEGGVLTEPWWPRPPMSAAEAEKQRRSFVYGSVSLSNRSVTRGMVNEVADRTSPPILGA